MHEGTDFRQFVYKVAEASRTDKNRGLKFRETLDTMILGTLSTSLGIVILVICLMAEIGIGSLALQGAAA